MRQVLVIFVLFLFKGEVVFGQTDDEDSEEILSTHKPQLLSTSVAVNATVGENVTFPCDVDDLGDFIILWIYGKNRILFAGDLRITRDQRIRIDGSSLQFTSVLPKDSGEYTCQITTLPPIKLAHTLDVLSQLDGEDMKEIPFTHKPRLLSTSVAVESTDGWNVTFPCDVDDLGDFVIVWKRDKHRILFVGDTRITRDERIRVDGSSLQITSVLPKDSGEYTCQIGTNPPIELAHTLHVFYNAFMIEEVGDEIFPNDKVYNIEQE